MAEIIKSSLGWRPDKPDRRDLRYSVAHLSPTLPISVDLRPWCPPVWDQGLIGSCTAQAISAALQFEAIKTKQSNANVVRSRLFIYYNERVMENSVEADTGAEIRDGIKSVAVDGVCNESLWWYNTEKFAVKPNKKCYDNALKYKALKYYRVPQTFEGLRGCLSEGFPIILGISVYDGFESSKVAKSGVASLPSSSEKMIGGHAILIVGYNDRNRLFTFRNSWGTGWGQGGYGFLPYDYLLNNDLADDLWTIRDAM